MVLILVIDFKKPKEFWSYLLQKVFEEEYLVEGKCNVINILFSKNEKKKNSQFLWSCCW